MFFRQLLNDRTASASYLFGCSTAGELAVVDAHADLVDQYLALAETAGSRITAVIETHLQADHVSGLPELVARTGATAGAVLVATMGDAQAYVDPGTGAMILQIIGALVAGTLFYYRQLRAKVASWFSRLTSRSGKNDKA